MYQRRCLIGGSTAHPASPARSVARQERRRFHVEKQRRVLVCPQDRRRRHRRQVTFETPRTAAALRASGTTATIARDFRIWRIDIVIARSGTSSIAVNHPSPTCWRRHASSSRTTRYGCSVSKSAGGSLNARWPFSPIPTNATSIGRTASSRPSSSHTATGSRPPSIAWKRDDTSRLNQPLAQVLPETRRMIGRQADILVEMKQLDLRPVEIGLAHQLIEEGNLRRSGRGDDPGAAGRGDRRPDARGCILRRGAGERERIGGNRDAHAGVSISQLQCGLVLVWVGGLDGALWRWQSSDWRWPSASPRLGPPPAGPAIEAKGSTPRAESRGFFTVARPSGGGWGSCGQRRTRP